MRGFGNTLGWITAYGFGLAILNFFVKFIFKNYITPFLKRKPNEAKKYSKIINIYKLVMKYVVRYHKIIGGIGTAALLFHLLLEMKYRYLSITGVIAALLMVSIILLGILGVTVFKKKPRGTWVNIHRVLSFLLILFILLHLAIKR